MRLDRLLASLVLMFVVAGCANRPQPRTRATPHSATNYFPITLHRTVTIITTNHGIFVSGEVKEPNRFIWTDGLTLTHAIRMAGGFTDFANRSRLELRRADGAIELFSHTAILKGMTNDPVLRPNDQIRVGKRGTFHLPPEAWSVLRAVL